MHSFQWTLFNAINECHAQKPKQLVGTSSAAIRIDESTSCDHSNEGFSATSSSSLPKSSGQFSHESFFRFSVPPSFSVFLKEIQKRLTNANISWFLTFISTHSVLNQLTQSQDNFFFLLFLPLFFLLNLIRKTR
jgi:hypothetical protein